MAGEQVTRKVEIFHNGVWEDISADAVDHDGETVITRGVRNEGGSAAPGSLHLTVNNGVSNVDPTVTSRYARGNALSDLFGLLPPNTPIRVSAGVGSTPVAVEEGFEDATLDIAVTDAGDAAWFRTTAQARSGSWSFRSGAITHDQTSDAVIAVPAGATELALWYRVSSETSFDFFEVLVGSKVALARSGEVDWTEFRVAVGTASTVTLRYRKDFIQSSGDDAAYVDDMAFSSSSTRMAGEVVQLPPRADVSQRDLWVPVEAAGPLRRLGIPDSPLRSPLRRFLPQYHLFDSSATEPLSLYWPCEDGSDSSTLSSGLSPGAPMRVAGQPDLASYTGFPGSEPLPRWTDGGRASVRVNLPLPDQSGANVPDLELLMLLHFPAGEISDGTDVISLNLQGAASRVVLQYETANNGILRALTFDEDGTQTASLGTNDVPPSPGMDDRDLVFRWRVSLDGENRHAFTIHDLLSDGSLDNILITAGGGIGGTITGLTGLTIAPNQDGGGFVLGQLVVARGSILEISEMQDAIGGYTGEPAGRRVERLCTEQSVPFTSLGDLDASAPLGPQQPGEFLTILDQAAKVEAAGPRAPILVEQRTASGVHFNALNALYLPRTADLNLDYAEAHLSPPFDPTPDDFGVVNDATASRRDGGSARVEVLDGPKGIDSAGRMDRADTFDAQTDDQLSSIAGWWSFQGTWDEPRYPAIRINMRSLSLRTDGATLVAAVQALDPGSLIEIANPPAWLPAETIQQMVLGITETILAEEWLVDLHTTPAGPFTVFTLGDTVFGRLDTAGSELALGVDASATSLLVATDSGKTRWTTDAERPSDFPFVARLGGELVTVTAISGTVSPQDFTVTRAVNGISRLWPAGTRLRIARVAVAP